MEVRRMDYRLLTGVFGLALVAFSGGARADEKVPPLDGPEAHVLARIARFHAVFLKDARLSARVLEDDGSASVAMNPIRLYLVVTNGGTSDYVGHVWELPKGVSRLRGVVPSRCGIDLFVQFDAMDDGGRVVEDPRRHTLRLCFLGPGGTLSDELRISDQTSGARNLK
jgi:hypothetical protein